MTLVFRGKRIRIQRSIGQASASRQSVTLATASLLMPCALLAFALTCWGMAAEQHWTAGFFIAGGIFSHWQSWLVVSLVLLLAARVLAQCVDETTKKY